MEILNFEFDEFNKFDFENSLDFGVRQAQFAKVSVWKGQARLDSRSQASLQKSEVGLIASCEVCKP